MKKIFCIFIGFIILNVCVPVLAEQTLKPAAPYTQLASEKISYLLEKYGLPPAPVKQNITSSDMLETYIQYYAKIWGMAGYDFKKSMDKYIHDMNINPNALAMPPIYDYTAPEILGYTTIQAFYQGNEDKLVLKKYFSQETINSFDKNLPPEPKYWFPQNVEASKLSDEQKSSYKLLDEEQYRYNYDPFVKQKVKEARMQGRPVIQKDLDDVARDQNLLKSIINSSSFDYSTDKYRDLNQSQIDELNRIAGEYGTDTLVNVGIPPRITKYIYTNIQTQNNASGVNQTTTNQMNNAPDRADVMRFYNGNGYYSPTVDTVKNVVAPSAINKILNYTFGLINF